MYVSITLNFVPVKSVVHKLCRRFRGEINSYHILLIFKRCLFQLRSASSTPSILYIVQEIKKIMQVEFEIAQNNDKLSFHFKKWDPINAFIDI